MPTKLNGFSDRVLSHWAPTRKNSQLPTLVQIGRPDSEGGVGEAEPSQTKTWSSPGHSILSWMIFGSFTM